ncbi:hypothetical protein IV505_19525 [Pseudomonas fulva]|nr:hypothetical protein [Pseudomonas fulva]MBF8781902.1 hypothetical protein [Pseudomonas fulva]
MSRWIPLLVLLLALGSCLAASHGVRLGLMEDARWVGRCLQPGGAWQCQARSLLGLAIHYQVIAWAALGLALLAQAMRGGRGQGLALAGLLLGIPALVLYTASIASFAVVLAGLRLVRGDVR